ncbi:hypothetical protein AAHE18_16G142800 [Arachis hypogaea]
MSGDMCVCARYLCFQLIPPSETLSQTVRLRDLRFMELIHLLSLRFLLHWPLLLLFHLHLSLRPSLSPSLRSMLIKEQVTIRHTQTYLLEYLGRPSDATF